MIISVDKVINDYHLFVDTPKELVQAKLDGLESLIRSKTNNDVKVDLYFSILVLSGINHKILLSFIAK